MECKGCIQGIRYCYHRPCWGTPEEFEKILEAGYGNRIQLEYWHQKARGGEDIEILAPALYMEKGSTDFDILNILFGDTNPTPREEREYEKEHNGGKAANLNPLGKCALLTEDNLCELHSIGLKPEEGKSACCKIEHDSGNHERLAREWDTDYGRSVVTKWKEIVNF